MIDRTVCYGLSHNLDGTPRTRTIRQLKVAIGIPTGPAVHVWIDMAQKWVVEYGVRDGETAKLKFERKEFAAMEDARKFYMEKRKVVPQRSYPGKLPYFTFQKIGMTGDFWPDWATIQRCGPLPTEIDIVFLDDAPLEQSYQWWTASQLNCEGNGIDGRRRVGVETKRPEDEEASKSAKERGEKWFPIVKGCHTQGCVFGAGENAVCGPHSRLRFQLAQSPVLGADCVFDTSGWQSGGALATGIRKLREITGRGDANAGVVAMIPMKLALMPYRTRMPNGKPALQYFVSLRVPAEGAAALFRRVQGQADEFRQLMTAQPQIAAPEPSEALTEDIEARTINAEFYAERAYEDETFSAPSPPPKEPRRRGEPPPEPEPEDDVVDGDIDPIPVNLPEYQSPQYRDSEVK